MLHAKSYSFTLLILHLLAFILTATPLSSQKITSEENQKIRLGILVLINNKKISDSATVTLRCVTDSVQVFTQAAARFELLLKYNKRYMVEVTGKNCNTKILYFDTKCPYGEWSLNAEVNLSTKNKDVVKAGELRYNDDLQTFVKYVVK